MKRDRLKDVRMCYFKGLIGMIDKLQKSLVIYRNARRDFLVVLHCEHGVTIKELSKLTGFSRERVREEIERRKRGI